jgi:hypothetical protein
VSVATRPLNVVSKKIIKYQLAESENAFVLSSLIETVESKARRHKLIEVTKQDVRARHVAKSVGSRKRKRNSSGRKLKLGQMWL